MNIRSMFKKIRDAYSRIGIFSKVLLLYLICGFVPMILSVLVFYNSMGRVLLEDAYSDMQENMLTMQKNFTQTLQPYQTLMEMLKNDRSLHILLNTDYSRTSYVELADYADTTLENMMAMYPELKRIRFYCDNPTLPSDEFYFYQKEDMDTELRDLLEHTAEGMLLCKDPEAQDSFVLVSKMNDHTSGSESSCLEFHISRQLIENILAADSSKDFLLLDTSGTVLASARSSGSPENIREILPDWESLAPDSVSSGISEDRTSYICLDSAAGMNLHLLILRDKAEILRSVRTLPLRLIIISFGIISFNALLAFFMSRNLHKRLNRIQRGMAAIGSGRFDEKIEDRGEDELGIIADGVNQLGTQLDQLIRENYQKQLTIKSTELNLLQEQINPHFLYNALAVISSLSMRENGRQTVQCIRYLADFYRISLNKGRKVITVGEEVELLRNYMKIQLIRFSDLVEIRYEIAPETEEFYTIKLLLQPLVENAIHHAREEEAFLSILVKARAEGERICFDVEDNGMGMKPKELQRLQQELQRQEEGFGLKNVDKRMKLAYGQDYGITVFSTPGVGTRIHLEIPKVRER